MNHARRGTTLCVFLILAIAVWAPPSTAQQRRSEAAEQKKSELSVVAPDVQMLLIAPNGKETGCDPKSQKRLHEIPDSAYYEDALLAYDSGRVDQNTTQTLDVKGPAPGTYRLVVSQGTAADGEEYEVRVRLYRPDGSEAPSVRIAGTMDRGEPATYELRLNADPTGVEIVSRPRR